jgi:hypothetical protein
MSTTTPDDGTQTGPPATVTTPVDASKTYRVTGPHPVHGTAPGETFTAVLDPGQEAFLLRGFIEIVRPTPDATTESADSADEETK